MRSLVPVALLAIFLASCQSAQRQKVAPRVELSIGKQVTLIGVAEPRKGGAALRGDNFLVWLKGVDSWPQPAVLKRVEVKGRLEEDHGLPVFIDKPNDPVIPQGIPVPEGTDMNDASRRLILVHPKWRLTNEDGAEPTAYSEDR